jgi:hypothetical protein
VTKPFKRIDLTCWPIIVSAFVERIFNGHDARVKELACDGIHLAESALHFYCGIYPKQAPYFVYDEIAVLPWHAEYSKLSTVDTETIAHLIWDDLEEVAADILAMAKGEASIDLDQMIFLSDFYCASPKLTVQGLAVAAMLCIDQYLDHLVTQDLVSAIQSLNVANRCIFEATIDCEEILRMGGRVRNPACTRRRARTWWREPLTTNGRGSH